MSFFEYTVAMAFYELKKEKVDIAIIETGLGGRLDSTNIVNPILSIITNIGYDHMNLLGDSLEEIAFEKAGIIKENTPVLIGKKQQEIDHVFKKQANKKNALLTYAKRFDNQFSEEIPDYQKEYINTVISAIDVLNWNISNEEINSGIKNVKINTDLRGRWEVLSTKPKIVCDTGHNIDGINQVINHLEKIKYGKLHFVFGTVNDKKLDSILNILPKDGIYYFCKAKIDGP